MRFTVPVLLMAISFSACDQPPAPVSIQPKAPSAAKAAGDAPEWFNLRPGLEKTYGYTHAVRVGDHITISGAVSMDDQGNPLAVGDLAQQMKNCYGDLTKVLKHYGCTFDDVVMENVFTTDMAEFIKQAAYRGTIYPKQFPAGSWLEVKGLAGVHDRDRTGSVQAKARFVGRCCQAGAEKYRGSTSSNGHFQRAIGTTLACGSAWLLSNLSLREFLWMAALAALLSAWYAIAVLLRKGIGRKAVAAGGCSPRSRSRGCHGPGRTRAYAGRVSADPRPGPARACSWRSSAKGMAASNRGNWWRPMARRTKAASTRLREQVFPPATQPGAKANFASGANNNTPNMKPVNILPFAVLSVTLLGAGNQAIAQDKPANTYITQTTTNIIIPEGSTREDILKTFQEYFDKVISKSSLVKHYAIFVHAWGSHGGSLVQSMELASWEDIGKLDNEIEALEKAAWPDEAARKAFLKKMAGCTSPYHSDEIYSVMNSMRK